MSSLSKGATSKFDVFGSNSLPANTFLYVLEPIKKAISCHKKSCTDAQKSTVRRPSQGHFIHGFLEFKNIQQSKSKYKKGLNGYLENYSASILTSGASSKNASKGSTRAKMRDNCILGGGEAFAREIALFSQFLPVGRLFLFTFLALASRGVVKSSYGRRQNIRNLDMKRPLTFYSSLNISTHHLGKKKKTLPIYGNQNIC